MQSIKINYPYESDNKILNFLYLSGIYVGLKKFSYVSLNDILYNNILLWVKKEVICKYKELQKDGISIQLLNDVYDSLINNKDVYLDIETSEILLDNYFTGVEYDIFYKYIVPLLKYYINKKIDTIIERFPLVCVSFPDGINIILSIRLTKFYIDPVTTINTHFHPINYCKINNIQDFVDSLTVIDYVTFNYKYPNVFNVLKMIEKVSLEPKIYDTENSIYTESITNNELYQLVKDILTKINDGNILFIDEFINFLANNMDKLEPKSKFEKNTIHNILMLLSLIELKQGYNIKDLKLKLVDKLNSEIEDGKKIYAVNEGLSSLQNIYKIALEAEEEEEGTTDTETEEGSEEEPKTDEPTEEDDEKQEEEPFMELFMEFGKDKDISAILYKISIYKQLYSLLINPIIPTEIKDNINIWLNYFIFITKAKSTEQFVKYINKLLKQYNINIKIK